MTKHVEEIVLTRVKPEESEDPAQGEFLGFLARDIASHPERIQAIDTALVKRIKSLVGKVNMDINEPLTSHIAE